MKYQPPWNTQFGRPVDDPDADYINANPAAGIEGSVPPAAAIEYPQREIVNAFQLAGFTATDEDLEQLTRGVRQGTAYAGATVIGGGNPNALYVNLNPQLDRYRAGLCLRLKIPVENTGPVGINIDSLGIRDVVRGNGAVLSAGDLRAGMVVEIVDDGEKFQIVNYQGFTTTTTNNNTYVVNIPYCVDLGSANSILAPFSPPITTLTPGLFVFVKIAAACTGPTVISVNGLPAVALVRTDLLPLARRDVIAGMVCGMVYDGTRFQMVSMPASIARDLTAPMDYYVAKTGSDSNDGLTPATPFLTINHALAMMSTWNNRGYQFTIHVGPGTYEERLALGPINGAGACKLIGDENTPGNVTIWDNIGSSLYTAACYAQGTDYRMSGFKFVSNGGNGISVGQGAYLTAWNLEFGYCARTQIFIEGGTFAWDSSVVAGAFIRISGSAQYHIEMFGGVKFHFQGQSPAIQMIITTSISLNAWNYCHGASTAEEKYSSITNKGNVGSGYKFIIAQNSIIDTGGQGPDYLPGTVAGYTASGGQYT